MKKRNANKVRVDSKKKEMAREGLSQEQEKLINSEVKDFRKALDRKRRWKAIGIKLISRSLAVMGAWIFLASSVFVGSQMIISKRGPGPDWNIQVGQNQPTGDPAESARRSIFGALPSTGHILWGSSFNENISEIDTNVVAPVRVEWSEAASHSGSGSIYLETAPIAFSEASFRRLGFPTKQDRLAVEVHALPYVDYIGWSEADLYITLEMNFRGFGNDMYIVSGILLSRSGGVTTLFYNDVSGALLDTGLTIPTFFPDSLDPWAYTYWRSLKLAIDCGGPVPKYAYLEYDGRRYDLSALTPTYSIPPAAPNIDRSFVFLHYTLRTGEDFPKMMNVDDIIITDNEP